MSAENPVDVVDIDLSQASSMHSPTRQQRLRYEGTGSIPNSANRGAVSYG
ncbi:hypothetical protein GCM10010136_21670 [Limoniibacter endophyticus]|uniref:Uncharacterized protein n=1 Tax=Limoniibacter endophyticus TaxID=1565040 RepID=A0A8J3DQX2_9HYPH|nr:hypothetical protein GCM10010136_21670 [Limoniibacter endophyticus]